MTVIDIFFCPIHLNLCFLCVSEQKIEKKTFLCVSVSVCQSLEQRRAKKRCQLVDQILLLCVFSDVFVSPSDGLVVVGVHSAKFPNEKVSVFPSLG